MSANDSLQNIAWKRLRKNKGAVFGLVIIAAAVFIAIFAYIIAPDSSPYGNRMVVEIAGQKPGFKQNFILLNNHRYIEKKNIFDRFFFGKEDNVDYVPVVSYTEHADSIVYKKYIDEGVSEDISVAKNNLSQPIESNFVTRKFLLGTDKFGRDILSRLIIGIRVSLGVGLIAVIISLSIGIVAGAVAGYYRGWVDDIVMWFVNVLWSIPTLLLVFAITLLLGKGFWQVFIAVGLTMWINVARMVRGQVMSVRELEYVEAGRALGFTNMRIIFKHILPNIWGPILVVAASNFASAIVIEAGLSFLGVGVQPPQPSWGLMIKENYNFIITHNPMLALAPGFAIMLLVLAFNLLGNGLRDALNVK
ncbi:ABC transporter permease [Pinibacter aurantiacus]|uniref:ABC transporter permease n=1 Tax=Pinibacter aurantiacus TaxID=2851599 RepID=A0A9E2SDD8_9BACT|nr:ABC transporter permease [Pinibacter aurantiacus]MBV4357805.1 ABC transporter permease [Pinibacter aurantiacus]